MTESAYTAQALSILVRELMAEGRITPNQARGLAAALEQSPPYDDDEPTTWARYSEIMDDGGKVALVRYPEGYRLRFNGETVWKQGDKQEITVTLNVDTFTLRDEISQIVHRIARDPFSRGRE